MGKTDFKGGLRPAHTRAGTTWWSDRPVSGLLGVNDSARAFPCEAQWLAGGTASDASYHPKLPLRGQCRILTDFPIIRRERRHLSREAAA